jgi:hypothetical protein
VELERRLIARLKTANIRFTDAQVVSNPWLRLGYTRAARVVDILERRGILGPGDGANISGLGCSGVKSIKESESFPLIRLHGVGLKRVCRGGEIGWKEITAGATCQKARD